MNELVGKFTECMKLVPNLRKKERYVIHYRNLKLYQSLGMQVTKIHRTLKFRQEAWMAPYIQLNTDLWAKATSEFQKDFFNNNNNNNPICKAPECQKTSVALADRNSRAN